MERRFIRSRWAGLTAAAVATVLAVASPASAVPSTTVVTASPAQTTVGGTVRLTATVTCASDPSGGIGVTFYDDTEELATVDVTSGGQAQYTTTLSRVGAHTITAAYNGNASCDASNSTTSVQVSETPVPPTQPSGGCLLFCGGLFGFTTGNVNNNIYVS
ncbi:Ig-like domain-containing protein [Streptomyces sp. H51]|uniref:Ig-like domain-containing protein n=1 Tax=Streptomyces sp. H51 TaxID=3111770 RepID=UPI002D77A870|nr:Ig-like domain-containing protein [Streptomyces sp. H51]